MHRTAALRIAIWGIFWSLAILAAHRTLAQPPDEPAPRRASGTAESAKAGRTADLPRGQWTDVLKLVELKKRNRRSARGGPRRRRWFWKTGIAGPCGNSRGPGRIVRLEDRVHPDRRRRDGGRDSAGRCSPVPGRSELQGRAQRAGHDQRPPRQRQRQHGPRGLSNDRRYRLEINVRPDGSEAAVTVMLDDRTLFFYRGPAASLARQGLGDPRPAPRAGTGRRGKHRVPHRPVTDQLRHRPHRTVRKYLSPFAPRKATIKYVLICRDKLIASVTR